MIIMILHLAKMGFKIKRHLNFFLFAEINVYINRRGFFYV